MKNKKILLISTFLLFSIMLLSLASSTITLVTPASSSTGSGQVSWNATITPGTFEDVGNCSIYAFSTLTANLTAVNVSTYFNVTANATNVTGTFNSTFIEDANNYQIYASCTNQTGAIQNSSAKTGITINNTVPVVPSSLSPASASKDTDGSVTFIGTVTGARTTSCTLYFVGRHPGSSSYTMTHTGNSCSRAITGILEETYDYYIQASDSSETANSAQTRFSVELPDTSSGYLFNNEVAQKAAEKKSGTLSIFVDENRNLKAGPIIILAIILVGIVVFIINRK